MNRSPFSLVTTCRNEIKSLPRWKDNLLSQDRFPDEIVIVDAFSNDGTYEFLLDWQKVETRIKLIQEKGNAAKGRNLAIKKASYDIVLSTDMGVRLSDNWCSSLITPFEKNAAIEVVAGSTCIDKETLNGPVGRAEFYIENGGIAKLEEGFVVGNRSVAYKKDVWEKLDGLPEDLTFYADDSVFGRQVVEGKFKMALAPSAMTYWARPEKLTDFWKEQFNYGKGEGEANIKKPYFFRLYENGKLFWPMAVIGNALWNTYKQANFKALGRAIRALDFSAVLILPVLAFGNGYYRIRGYKKGHEFGQINCTSCRNRLHLEW